MVVALDSRCNASAAPALIDLHDRRWDRQNPLPERRGWGLRYEMTTQQEIVLGPWRAQFLECGTLALDGGAMFGSVPRVLWEKMIPPDAAHRIPLAMRLVLLRHASGSPVVLVDSGVGDKIDVRFRQMFDVRLPTAAPGRTPLEATLAAAGVAPESVTHVILTHLHFDHGGGATRRDGERVVPVFPRAEHFLQRRNWDTARSPNARERASYLPENVEPLAAARLELLGGPAEVLPGISVLLSEGHTAGLQMVRVEGGERSLYFVADLAPTHHHVHLPFCMGYDLCVRTILEEKAALWPRIAAENGILVFEHDPSVAAATLERTGEKWRAVPLPASPESVGPAPG